MAIQLLPDLFSGDRSGHGNVLTAGAHLAAHRRSSLTAPTEGVLLHRVLRAATPRMPGIYAGHMKTRYVLVGGSRDAEILTEDGELFTNVDLGIEDYQLDDPPRELSIEGGFAYVLRYHGLAAG